MLGEQVHQTTGWRIARRGKRKLRNQDTRSTLSAAAATTGGLLLLLLLLLLGIKRPRPCRLHKPVLEKAGRSPSGFFAPLNRTENRCPSPFIVYTPLAEFPPLSALGARRRGPPLRERD